LKECEEVHEEKPITCKSCGYGLAGEDPQPERHQVVDLPVIKPLVIEYRLHELAWIIHDDFEKSPDASLARQSGDWSRKQCIF
jgi:hypothetical protein